MSEIYEKARKLGEKEYRKQVAEGRYPYVPSLDYMVHDVDRLPQVKVGLIEIPLSLVVGTKTVGRTNAFARNFMPVLAEKSEFAAKWSSLYEYQVSEGIQDPVKVFEFIGRFYIQEGNKRVSVLKFVDAPSVMADVTRIMPEKTDDPEVVNYYEFLEFFRVCPTYELRISTPGGYRAFAGILGLNLDNTWSDSTQMDVRSAISVFERSFYAKGGERLAIQSGDALLIYLHFYRLDSLLNDSDEVISRRLTKLWNEFMTAANDDNLELVERPEKMNEEKGLLDFLLYPPAYTMQKPLKAAFMYEKTPETSSWNYMHELGRNHVMEVFGETVDIRRYDNTGTNEELADRIDEAVNDGCEVIFTTSPSQMPRTLRAAVHYNDQPVHFLNCSVNLPHNALRSYYCRIHEAKFVMGALAACEAEDHRIGYRADYPIYGAIAGINAFALGAAMIDPQAKIYLEWSTMKDHDWKQSFREQGISVISGSDMIRPQEMTREYGLYRIDYAADELQHIAAPLWDWGKFYELLFRRYMEWQRVEKVKVADDVGLNYWWGMDAGVVGVVNSVRTSYHTRRLSDFLCASIREGRLYPFEGEIHSAEGVIREEGDPRLSNEEIITMDWLCDNIIGKIPYPDELAEDSRLSAYISGVKQRRA